MIMTHGPSLHAEMPLRDVIANWPGAQRALFSRYHIGGCRSCAYSPEETLAALCARNDNISVNEVMDHIRTQSEADAKLLLEPGKLKETLSSDNPPLLLDLRTREEHEAVTIPGSTLATETVMQRLFSAPGREFKIVLFDHKGNNALDAASYFIGHGFPHVFVLKGGIDHYSETVEPGLPRYELETDQTP